jgi:hypothetical protein
MYSVGDVVIITTDHPHGTVNTCVKDRLGVITKIELYDDNNQITYSIRDVCDDNFLYEDKEFKFATVGDLRNYICNALKIDPSIATFHTNTSF